MAREWTPKYRPLTDEQIKSKTVSWAGNAPVGLEKFSGSLLEAYPGPAIYFLVLNLEVVYVGVSIRPLHRITEHAEGTPSTPKKDFDRAAFLPTSVEELFERELVFIAMLNPPLNIVGKTCGAIARSYSKNGSHDDNPR